MYCIVHVHDTNYMYVIHRNGSLEAAALTDLPEGPTPNFQLHITSYVAVATCISNADV